MKYPHFLSDPVFKVCSETASALGYECFVVGGYVRDCFLERNKKDIDIVVVGDGIKYAKALAGNLGSRGINIFKTFGTAQIKLTDWEIEIVGARKESYSADSRNPAVLPGTIDDDQNRRDFTINALALSLSKSSFGELLDSFHGLEDLNNKIIKTPLDPDITFSDDPLRMLRAIRFASQLGFKIDETTYEGIVRNKDRISIISKERITDELNKIILSAKPSVGFNLLFDTGLLKLIFPEMQALYGVEKINEWAHKDNFYHTLQVLDNICKTTDDLWLRWAAILHDIAKPATKKFIEGEGWTFHGHEDRGARMVPKIFNAMKLPMNEKMRFVQKMVLLHLRPIALSKENITDSAIRRLIFEAGEDIDSLMKLCRADITSKSEAKKKKYLENFDLVEQKIEEVEAKDHLRNWQPPVTGEMIMEAFGMAPSREIGIIKLAIREAILDGVIENNFDSAYAFMIAEGKKLGLEIKK